MPIYQRENQYRGVNAHLHSHFQNKGGWSSFHTNYITHLAAQINDQLPAGYLVDIEQSLQIREFHPDTGERLRKPEPDITVYDSQPAVPRPTSASSSSALVTLTRPAIETVELAEDQYYSALVIYQTLDDPSLGRPVTRIELLSPTNKQGDGYLQYREKRHAALKSGLRMVEIDYLHQTLSPVKDIPAYPNQSQSYPYNITVSDPIPSLEKGLANTYGFGVDDPIPSIEIPLAGDDRLLVDFDAVYQRTFKSLSAYSQRVNYEQLPERFDTYSPADQQRIRERMAVVTTAV